VARATDTGVVGREPGSTGRHAVVAAAVGFGAADEVQGAQLGARVVEHGPAVLDHQRGHSVVVVDPERQMSESELVRRAAFGVAGGQLLAGDAPAGAADTVAQMLSIKPKQEGVAYASPSAGEQAGCKVELAKADRGSGWLLKDKDGGTKEKDIEYRVKAYRFLLQADFLDEAAEELKDLVKAHPNFFETRRRASQGRAIQVRRRPEGAIPPPEEASSHQW